MTGYARTGGNLKGKRKPRKPAQMRPHFDPRMQWTIEWIKQAFPGCCQPVRSVKLVDETTSAKTNR